MQGPDVGIGTTVEDVEELPPRSAARRRRRFRAALASVPRGSMPPQPPRTNTRRRRSSCAPQATSAPRSLPPPPRCCASAAQVRHAPSRSRCRGDLNRGIGGGFGEGVLGAGWAKMGQAGLARGEGGPAGWLVGCWV